MTDPGVIRPIVVAPTFNNAATLPAGVLRGLDELGLPVHVVDDGSEDDTPALLRAWAGEHPARSWTRHENNQGKAAALATGFAAAERAGHTHAVSIDTDGQLDPAQVPELLRRAAERPNSLILGSRDAAAVGYPLRSRLGRRAANLLVWWESGARVHDSQCGFRVYPLRAVHRLSCRAGRYGFETEVLTRAAWAGIPIDQVPVRCVYPSGRVSHYRPWRDSLGMVRLHAGLMTLAFSPRRGLRLNHAADTGRVPLRLARWFSPSRMWQELKRGDPQHRTRFAAAVGVGVFIGNLPLYGVQTLLCLYAARRMRLNPLPIILGCSVSTPPLGPALVALAIAVGHWCLHGTLPQLSDFHAVIHGGYFALLKSVLLEWCIGSVVCGVVLGTAAFALTILIVRWLPRKSAVTALPLVDTPVAPATRQGVRATALDPTDAKSTV